MKLLILAVLVACASASSVSPALIASILGGNIQGTPVNSYVQNVPEGSFQYSYDTDTGITSNAQGKLKNLGKDEVALEVTGYNSYTSPEGEKVEIRYVANENGYQPQGSHLPVAPEPLPIPDYIVRSIEYIKAHPAPVEKKL